MDESKTAIPPGPTYQEGAVDLGSFPHSVQRKVDGKPELLCLSQVGESVTLFCWLASSFSTFETGRTGRSKN
jgi:hypothetical protein